MQRAGRSYLNARYEPMKRTINNNEENKIFAPFTKNKIDKCQDFETNMSKKITTPENLRNFFKFASLFWYFIIVSALSFNFVSFFLKSKIK